MLQKNVASQGVYLFAWNTSTNAPDTGDAANITGTITKDGGAGAATGTANPTEIGGGVYWQPLAQGETNANAVALYWSSTTANVRIDPVFVLTDAGLGAAVAAIPTTPLLAANVPANFSALGITAGGNISEVALVDTLTTYTGNTPQTADVGAGVNVTKVNGHTVTGAGTSGNPWGSAG